MSNVAAQLGRAIAAHQAGQLDIAEQLYQQILSVDAQHADALHLLGVVAYQSGRHQLAIEQIEAALQIRPDQPEFYSNLGGALRAIGRLEEAGRAFRRAISLRRGYAEAHNNLAALLQQQGNSVEALHSYQRAVELRPDYVDALRGMAAVLMSLGRRDEAVQWYSRVVELRPQNAAAHYRLGVVLHGIGRRVDAVSHLQHAVALQADHAEAHSRLGIVLAELDRIDEAEDHMRTAVGLRPDNAKIRIHLALVLKQQRKFDEALAEVDVALEQDTDSADAYNTRGLILADMDRMDDALASYRLSISLQSDLAEAHNNLGAALWGLGDADEAVEEFQLAIQLAPELAEAHVNLAASHLIEGRFEQGWAEYEWRLPRASRIDVRPQWAGSQLERETLEGKTVLLEAEQGLGDTLQFVRYAPLVAALGARVSLRCQDSLVPLLTSSPGIAGCVPQSQASPRTDVTAPLMSLPYYFGTDIATIPNELPYVFPPRKLVERWHQRLAEIVGDGLRVGVHWQGNPRYARDRSRSAPLKYFEPLAKVPGVRLLSLQFGDGVDQLDTLDDRFQIARLPPDVDTDTGPFMDTAAILLNLDLVVAVDAVVCHLAGALGARVWSVHATVPDWRWGRTGETSPWYPTMRLFRQQVRGDWNSVARQMAAVLARDNSR